MNAGTFGTPSGNLSHGRKLARQLRAATQVSYLSLASGGQVSAVSASLSVSVGVRTQSMSITGRGALRFLGVCNTVATATNLRLEILLDGVTVCDVTASGCSDGSGPVGVGTFVYAGSAAQGQWDYVPFDSTLQIFVTSSAVANPTLLYVVDLHQ